MDAIIGRYRIRMEETRLVITHPAGISFDLTLDETLGLMDFIQIYRRDFLQNTPTISTATSFLTPEKIIRAHAQGLRVVEVEIDYHRRELGTPSSANAKNIKQALRDMARLRVALMREARLRRGAS